VKPSLGREEFFRKHGFDPARPLIAVLPGSRRGEAARHLPALIEAIRVLDRERAMTFVLPASANTGARFFLDRIGRCTGDAPLRVIEGESWDAMAHATLALAASGTVTVEAALLGVPMVTFYKVTAPSWLLGRLMVKVPYYTMVNLIAGRRVVPELMQGQMTGARIAREARKLLDSPDERERMMAGLEEVGRRLAEAGPGQAPLRAASIIRDILEGQVAHVS
jgi:lipid-A-disaccharide synthase